MSITIYRMSDRIPVTIGKLKFWLAPLSYGQKVDIAGATQVKSGEEIQNHMEAASKAIRYSVKKVEGLQLADGSAYAIVLDDTGIMSEDSLSEIMQLSEATKLVEACSLMISEIKEHKISGINIDLKGVVDRKKLGE